MVSDLYSTGAHLTGVAQPIPVKRTIRANKIDFETFIT